MAIGFTIDKGGSTKKSPAIKPSPVTVKPTYNRAAAIAAGANAGNRSSTSGSGTTLKI